MVEACIPPSIIAETVCRALQKACRRWMHVQRKGILTKNDLKLRFKFAWEVRHKRAMCNYEIWNHQKTLELDRVKFNEIYTLLEAEFGDDPLLI